ncbi:hypothetical protein L6452_18247 [Arctium lappa]|uniref:Uncharacterized protein n=1 Tax=Arctium lappa TaxID=4217 RepID=A0ACB9C5J1_ARCLA|nr:hypothetical protein L6452_18247 [Arctium lappa]
MDKGKEKVDGYCADDEQYIAMQKIYTGENHPSNFGEYSQYNHTLVWTPPYSSSAERYARDQGWECYLFDNDPYFSIAPEVSDCPTRNSMQEYLGNRPEQVQSREPTLAYDPRRHSDAGPSRSRRDPVIKMNADLYLAWKDDWREKLKRTRSLQDRNDRLAAENKKLKESIKEANKSIFNRFSRIVNRVINWAKGKPSTSETLRIDLHRSSSGSRHMRH